MLTAEDCHHIARACRGMAYRIRQRAEKHRLTGTYGGQIAEAERFEGLAERFERGRVLLAGSTPLRR